MKRIVALIAALLLVSAPLPVLADAEDQAVEPSLASLAAVLIDASSGQVLYEKDAYARMAPASITKIMTGLLCVENLDLDMVMTVSASAVDIDEPEAANINLQPGEQLTVRDAMYALMMPSANDAANVIAEYVAGSQSAFAEMMTERAHDMGALDTNFANAHGLDEDGHYTTAYDMALITQQAIRNETFLHFFSAEEYTMPATAFSTAREFNTPHQMKVDTSAYYYPPVIGGKTGLTYNAMYTLSSAGTSNGRTLITVVLHADTRADTFWDTQALMEFGFNEFQPVTISSERYGDFTVPILDEGATVGNVEFSGGRDFNALVHNSVDPSAISVSILYDVPFTRDSEDYTCTVAIEAPELVPGVPTFIGSFTLDAEVDLPPPVTLIIQESNFTDMLTGWVSAIKDDVFTIFLIFGLVTTGFLFICVGIRSHNLKKRRRIRQQRLRQQKQRELTQRGRQPTAQYGGVRPHITANSHRSRYAASATRR